MIQIAAFCDGSTRSQISHPNSPAEFFLSRNLEQIHGCVKFHFNIYYKVLCCRDWFLYLPIHEQIHDALLCLQLLILLSSKHVKLFAHGTYCLSLNTGDSQQVLDSSPFNTCACYWLAKCSDRGLCHLIRRVDPPSVATWLGGCSETLAAPHGFRYHSVTLDRWERRGANLYWLETKNIILSRFSCLLPNPSPRIWLMQTFVLIRIWRS